MKKQSKITTAKKGKSDEKAQLPIEPSQIPTPEPTIIPASESQGKMASGFGRKVSHLLIEGILFLGAIALIAYQIGTPSLFETSEGRFASIARTMVDSGDWLIPRFNGLVHLSKPPLAYWASAIGQNFFGFTETGARALLPLAAGLTILGCFRIGRLFMSMRGALISTFVLLTSLFFNVQFRGLTSDPFLAMFETWMVWALISYAVS